MITNLATSAAEATTRPAITPDLGTCSGEYVYHSQKKSGQVGDQGRKSPPPFYSSVTIAHVNTHVYEKAKIKNTAIQALLRPAGIAELRLLSRSAVISRYPGEFAELEETQVAFNICARLRDRLRDVLGCQN